MKKGHPISLILHTPKTEEGNRELARLVSEIHAQFVLSALGALDCPPEQKAALLQAVIDAVRGGAL